MVFEPVCTCAVCRCFVHVSYIWLSGIEHSTEHFGQLVVYYRANNLVPPESRR